MQLSLLILSAVPLILASSHPNHGHVAIPHKRAADSVHKRVMEGTSFSGSNRRVRNFGDSVGVVERSTNSVSSESKSLQGALDSTLSALSSQLTTVNLQLTSQSKGSAWTGNANAGSAGSSSQNVGSVASSTATAVELAASSNAKSVSVVAGSSSEKSKSGTSTVSNAVGSSVGSSSSTTSTVAKSGTGFGYTSSGMNLDQSHSGDGTFFDVGLGACGNYNVNTDYIVAVSYLLFQTFPGAGDNPNNNPICNKKLNVTYNGVTIQVYIADECMGCENPWSLDFSPSAFSAIADQSSGRIGGVTWTFA